MALLRIRDAVPSGGFKLKLTPSDGTLIERDLEPLLRGRVFEKIRNDVAEFARVRVEGGTLVWPNGADLCPDAIIWNGLPPEAGEARPPNTAK